MNDVSIVVNGRKEKLHRPATIRDMLQAVAIDPDRRGIAVALNDHVVRRGEWETQELTEGDRIDVIQASQGG